MKVLEIKNNLVKVLYDSEERLVLGAFTVIEDDATPYVGQVVSLKADNGISYAIVRLLFTFDGEGIVKNYDGSIPKLDANVTILSASDLLEILPVETPVKLGKLAQQEFILNVDNSILQNNLLICSDNSKNTGILVSNFAKQIENNAESSVIFDTDGKYPDDKKIVFGKNFKLPLNFDSINFIYGNDLNDVDATSRAVIQDIFLEVQEYTRTIPDKFIPFDTFIEVVSQQYAESEIPELALLKNKLLKYKEENVFAQSKYEITSLKEYIKDNYTTVIDISNISSSLQREVIAYVYSVLDEMNTPIYTFVKINDDNSDKKLLKLLLNENKIYTNIICNHNYKYVYELKEKANDLILFAPETTRHDFSAYNTFLNKLNHDEFVVCGVSTQNIPLIIELSPIEIVKPEPIYISDSQVVESSDEDGVNEINPADAVSEVVVNSKETELKEGNQSDGNDFTENEDTYSDLSDDIERKPQEEEDYSALSNSENDVEYEEEDDFDSALDSSMEVDDEPKSEVEDEDFVSAPEEDEEQEAATNDFFTINEPEENFRQEPFAEVEEVIMPDGEVVDEEEIEIQSAGPEDAIVSDVEPQISYMETLQEPVVEELQDSEVEDLEETEISNPPYSEVEEVSETPDDNLQGDVEAFYEEEKNEDLFRKIETEPQEEPVLPEPLIDERIDADFNSELQVEEQIQEEVEISGENIESDIVEGTEFLSSEEVEQTPYENELAPDNVPLMPEDDELNNNLIAQVAKDIDQTFIYNKIEDESLDEGNNSADLTEDDLNFIDDINHGENEILEPVADASENFDEEREEFSDEEQEDTPVVPVYQAKIPEAAQNFEQGDHVSHPKYGEGIVEKMIKYGSKTLCSINFVNVGRRLLDPAISEISKL